MLCPVNTYDQHVGARLLDFFDAATPWHRSLWNPSLVLTLKETLEASEAFRASARGKESLKDLINHAVKLAGSDPGTGEPKQRQLLQKALGTTLPHDGLDYLTVAGITEDIEAQYLARWSAVLADPNTRPRPERTARAVAAYLLDLGFSSNFLHRWWAYRIRHEPGTREMADLLRDAHRLAQSARRTFDVLIAFETAPRGPAGLPPRWIDAASASAWLKQHHFGAQGIRQEGGMLFQLLARDADSAVEAATELLDNFAARLEISTNLPWKPPVPTAWVANEQRPFKLGRRTRKVHVRALEREAQIYSASTPSIVDAALELLAPLQASSPSAAVAGGWAAIEALLSEPGNHAIAAERLASLVACSFPRAELTFLSYLVQHRPGPLAAALSACATNRARCAVLTNALDSNTPLGLSKPSDLAAVERMRGVLTAPYVKLHDIQAHATNALLRLYRQRNLVLHWGKTDAVALRASLRTAAPLVGAGMDRIAHAWFVQEIRPLELAARARIALAVIGTRPGTNCLDLLA
jgi:hypothetical protein